MREVADVAFEPNSTPLLALGETLFTVMRIEPVAHRRSPEHLLDISASRPKRMDLHQGAEP